MSSHEISFNTAFSDPIRTRADFIYKITPIMISITDTSLGQCSVTEDIEAVLRKIDDYYDAGLILIDCTPGSGRMAFRSQPAPHGAQGSTVARYAAGTESMRHAGVAVTTGYYVDKKSKVSSGQGLVFSDRIVEFKQQKERGR
jgi:hypothetical protein